MTTKRILVIDDEAPIREIIEICLETMAGWEVLKAASGREGLTTATTEQPDAILLDVMMPDMDGPTTFTQLQANAETKHIPTVLLTADIEPNEQQRLLDLGITGVLKKPLKADVLVDQLREILGWQE